MPEPLGHARDRACQEQVCWAREGGLHVMAKPRFHRGNYRVFIRVGPRPGTMYAAGILYSAIYIMTCRYSPCSDREYGAG